MPQADRRPACRELAVDPLLWPKRIRAALRTIRSTTRLLWKGRPVVGEFINTSSGLLGYPVDTSPELAAEIVVRLLLHPELRHQSGLHVLPCLRRQESRVAEDAFHVEAESLGP